MVAFFSLGGLERYPPSRPAFVFLGPDVVASTKLGRARCRPDDRPARLKKIKTRIYYTRKPSPTLANSTL